MKPSLIIVCLIAFSLSAATLAVTEDEEKATCHIRLDPGHPWQPPFGLERVGKSVTTVVEISTDRPPVRQYVLAAYRDGTEVSRDRLPLTGQSPYTNRVEFKSWPAELVVCAKSAGGESIELARQPLQPPAFEAEAIARPNTIINPVDLGAILPPADWLLLGTDQKASAEVAALSWNRDVPGAQVEAWFEAAPQEKTAVPIELVKNRRVQIKLRLPGIPSKVDRDRLHITITGGDGEELWHKKILAMFVHHPPRWPGFGATETQLRYDLPILVLANTAYDAPITELPSIPYAEGWAPERKDIVVSFPNGSRFVFWRGSNYIPFWAGRFNTGLSYECAETWPQARTPPKVGFCNDCMDPLTDKELRYSRVEIVESTDARVQVRWSYQPCDHNYKVLGEGAVEDFYFYPDGLGTRVLTLQSEPGALYETSEFIILTPPATYPFSVLVSNMVDILLLDGSKREISFPRNMEFNWVPPTPAMYRIRLNKDEVQTAIYFYSNKIRQPIPQAFVSLYCPPMFDRGYLVTPCYWGNHWPLTRGKYSGNLIDVDHINSAPAHNSTVTFGTCQPEPVRTVTLVTLDTLGRSKLMTQERWVWHIGMTEASDARLLEWAHSLSQPPSVELQGAQLDFEAYAPERRAIRLKVGQSTVTITIRPVGKAGIKCVNPVFELLRAPRRLARIELGGRALPPEEYAWDGQTLWLNATLAEPARLQIQFGRARPGNGQFGCRPGRFEPEPGVYSGSGV